MHDLEPDFVVGTKQAGKWTGSTWSVEWEAKTWQLKYEGMFGSEAI